MAVSFTIRLSTGTKWSITLDDETNDCASISVLQVKEHLLSSKDQYDYLKDVIHVDRLRLIFKGRIMDNDRNLSDYGIVAGATIFLVKTSAPAGSNPTNASTTTATRQSSSTTPVSSTPTSSGTSTNAALPNPWGAPTQQFNPMMSGAGGSNPMQNPMMQNLMDNNPDLVRNLLQQQMESNPAIRQMMDQNPALAQMMRDPAALDHAMNMMRNPAAMQQAMRQQDLALSQLENMPGGMAALSSMYQQYQQPLQESMMGSSASSSTSNNSVSSSSSSGAGASGQAMPNPWGSPSTSTPRSTGNPTSGVPNPWANSGGSNPNDVMSALNQMGRGMGSGLGGLGGAGMGSGAPSRAERDALLQMLENPGMREMMQNMMRQNPGMIRQALMQQNPMAAQMLGNNPEMIDQMVQQMMNPETLRAMFAMQDQMEGLNLQGNSGTSNPANLFGGARQSGLSGLDFSQLLSSVGGNQQAHTSQQPPAERYALQLRSLYDMGFDDEQRNLQALQQVHGNLNRAVDYLLTMPVPTAPPQPPNSSTSDSSNSDKNESPSEE